MKYIPLMNSPRTTIVSDEDYVWASEYDWYFYNGFAVRPVADEETGEIEMMEMGYEVLLRAGKLSE